jgi:hypothetical protein
MTSMELEVLKTLVPVAVACISTGSDIQSACEKLMAEVKSMSSCQDRVQSCKQPECSP